MVDSGAAALTGLAGAGLVAGGVVALGLTAPVWALLGATAVIGAGLGVLLDSTMINGEPVLALLKDKVAGGLSAWGGIYQNARTIVQVGTERVADRIVGGLQAWQGVADNARTIAEVAVDRAEEAVSNVVDRVTNQIETTAMEISGIVDPSVQNVRETASGLVDDAKSFIGHLFGGAD